MFRGKCSNINGISTFLWQNYTSISSGWRTEQRRKCRGVCFASGKILIALAIVRLSKLAFRRQKLSFVEFSTFLPSRKLFRGQWKGPSFFKLPLNFSNLLSNSSSLFQLYNYWIYHQTWFFFVLRGNSVFSVCHLCSF